MGVSSRDLGRTQGVALFFPHPLRQRLSLNNLDHFRKGLCAIKQLKAVMSQQVLGLEPKERPRCWGASRAKGNQGAHEAADAQRAQIGAAA